ncbi:hypothetical protein [Halorubrum tebenquichense]|uniref:hypothetical protein n=1 Tax=Halorubrum tebenquichense TaxID=119434 RepID=UPI000ADFACD9|nr:hypothetical protein [Halorubrum tebenquichense]
MDGIDLGYVLVDEGNAKHKREQIGINLLDGRIYELHALTDKEIEMFEVVIK